MNKKDMRIVKSIVDDCIRGTLATAKARKHADYFLRGVPVKYQFEHYPLNRGGNHNHSTIYHYLQNFKGQKSVLDLDRREAFDAAKDYFSYSLLRVFGDSLGNIPNLCIFPVPTCADEASYYGEWNEVMESVGRRTGARNCIGAFQHHYREYAGCKWQEGYELPDGRFNQDVFRTEDNDTANIILLADSIYQGTIVQETIDILRDMGNEVIIVLSLSQVII